MSETDKNNNKYDIIRLENQICFPLYACAKELTRKYRKPLERLELTYTQYIVMMVLWEKGSMTVSELGKTVHLDSGTLTPLLKRLEKLEYITRVRPDHDERQLIVSLTKKGDDLKEEALKVPEDMRGCIDLTPEEQKQLKYLLDKALSQL